MTRNPTRLDFRISRSAKICRPCGWAIPLRRIEDDRQRIDITVEDPVDFTGPWSGQRHYRRVEWDIEEFVCMDNVNFEEFERQVPEYEADSD